MTTGPCHAILRATVEGEGCPHVRYREPGVLEARRRLCGRMASRGRAERERVGRDALPGVIGAAR